MQNTICIYTSYSKSAYIDAYIQHALVNIKPICQTIIFATNKRAFHTDADLFFTKHNIHVLLCDNKGYDFGKIYLAFKQYNCTGYDRIILMNDSLIQIGNTTKFFNWINASTADVLGLINSNEKTAHIQSYFLVINKNAINLTLNYFAKHKRYYSKKNVIKVYELGLTTYWLQHKLKVVTYIDVNNFESGYAKNAMYEKLHDLLQLNIPYIKRHLLMDSFGKKEKESLAKTGFNLDANYWRMQIEKYYSNSVE